MKCDREAEEKGIEDVANPLPGRACSTEDGEDPYGAGVS
jgi:hypothetical protein